MAPGFTAIALITLALGIGANTAIFSVIDGVLIKPLPFPESERPIAVLHVAPGIAGFKNVGCAPTMYFTYREQNQTLENIGCYSTGSASVTGLGEPQQVRSLDVTYGTLEALRVQPALGRWFSQVDDTPGTPETVILTYGYWQRRFGDDKSVLGRTLTLNSRPRTIIGIMPRDFSFLSADADVILPQRFDRAKVFLGNFSYQGIARLKPGVTIPQADADIARMIPVWLKSWPPPPGFTTTLFENARFAPEFEPLKELVVGNVGATLWILMGTLGLVLLIACANVANLLLVRAEGRQQELAIRAALGAAWTRIAREMLLESLTLGIIGGVLGVGIAYVALKLLVRLGPATLPRLTEIGIDPLVLAFTAAVSLFAGLLFGLIPIVKYAGPQIAGSLRSGGRTASHSRDRHRARNTLVVVQVALALVLLIGSGLMIRTFQALRNVQPGFTPDEHVQLIRISIPEAQIKEPEQVMRAENAMLDKLAAIPGVTSVAFSTSAPLDGFRSGDLVYAEDRDYAKGQIPPTRLFRWVTPGYFNTAGTAFVAGRELTWTDLYDKRHVAIVSENMARELWGSPQDALGKRIRQDSASPWREIVGVVRDVYDNGLQEKPPSFVYWPALMDHFWGEDIRANRGGVFLIRTQRASTESFLAEARQAIWSVNANLPLFLVRTLKDVYDQSMARTSFTLVMLAIAGGMAMVLGMIGIYGVISYAVSQRTREIGIRVALGAEPSAVHRMFVRNGLLMAGLGAAIGLAAAAALTQLMKSILFGVTAFDPVTYGLVALFLLAAAALASYIPARRAAAVDPIQALRAE